MDFAVIAPGAFRSETNEATNSDQSTLFRSAAASGLLADRRAGVGKRLPDLVVATKCESKRTWAYPRAMLTWISRTLGSFCARETIVFTFIWTAMPAIRLGEGSSERQIT